jgi:hypothetical protein
MIVPFRIALRIHGGARFGAEKILPAREIGFRTLPNGVLASDALVALRYGRGRSIYPRSIILPRGSRPDGTLQIGARDFLPFRDAAPVVLGWARRPELRFAGSVEVDADQIHWDRDWASNGAPASIEARLYSPADPQNDEGGPKNTRLRYLYRDGANYKGYVDLVLAGSLSVGGASLIREACEEDERFLPTQVGLPPAQEELWKSHGRSDDDHVWNELVELSTTDDDPTPGAPAIPDLLARFEAVLVQGWDILAAMRRLGLEG